MSKQREKIAGYIGGRLEFVDTMWTEEEVDTAIAKMRAWVHDDGDLLLPRAREQVADELWMARKHLRWLRRPLWNPSATCRPLSMEHSLTPPIQTPLNR